MSVATAAPPRSTSSDEKPFPEYLADLMRQGKVVRRWGEMNYEDNFILGRLLNGHLDQSIDVYWFRRCFAYHDRDVTFNRLYDRYFLWSTLEGRP